MSEAPNEREFRQPPGEYGPVPFWFWNDGLDISSLLWQLDEMRDKGISSCVIHARKGLGPGYLSEEWFAAVGAVLDHAAQTGMRVWIYDEDNWPSGYAGGRVARENPEFAARCLTREKIYPVLGKTLTVPERPGTRLAGVVAAYENRRFVDLLDPQTGRVKEWAPQTLRWEVHVFREQTCAHRPAYSDLPYTDLLNSKAVSCFVHVTHAEYKRRFPQHWGKTLCGFFTDEPGFYQNYFDQEANVGAIAWTPDFPQRFAAIKHYDLMPVLCSVWEDMGDLSRRTRRDYYEVLTKLYVESYFGTIRDFCAPDGVLCMGHIHKEESLRDAVQMEGHFFETMRLLDIPGIDCIDRTFPRVTEKLGSSAAHLFGHSRCFSETFGCFGWELTPAEMKRRTDLQYAQGINLLVPHAFFSSIEGTRVQESPPSEFYQNEYWPYYRLFADYVSRLSYALTRGRPVCDALVYYPITSAWQLYEPLKQYPVMRLDEDFRTLSAQLLRGGVAFDYIDDDALAVRGVIKEGKLSVGDVCARCVIVPSVTNLPLGTLHALASFAESGGHIVFAGRLPDGASDPGDDGLFAEALKTLLHAPNVSVCEGGDKAARLLRNKGLCTVRCDIPAPNLFFCARTHADADVFFFTNQGDVPVETGVWLASCGEAQCWNAETGNVSPLPSRREHGGTRIRLSLGAGESVLIVLARPSVPLDGAWKIEMVGKTHSAPIAPWAQLGVHGYSGTAHYRRTFELPEQFTDGRSVWLDLGDVQDFASVRLNGQDLGARLWPPYRWRIDGVIRPGENELEVAAGNTLANRLTGSDEPAGVLGPARITHGRKPGGTFE